MPAALRITRSFARFLVGVAPLGNIAGLGQEFACEQALSTVQQALKARVRFAKVVQTTGEFKYVSQLFLHSGTFRKSVGKIGNSRKVFSQRHRQSPRGCRIML